ncbi:uncharacterized protein G2W53_008496 [Senna tora]|uniref:Transmembrane protein n=1 Tax=Senna tora TaxID=362788 RepID=A0A835CF99_9FABA|nr:uncharacterized protein G2W53_008496 [Senna tora]
MPNSLQLQATKSPLWPSSKNLSAGNIDARRRVPCRRRASLSFTSLTLQSRSDAAVPPPSSTSEPSSSHSHFTSAVGSSLISSSLHPSQWNLTQRHITLLNLIACLTAVSATWLFCSAIPTLLAFKRAAESLEKLMDATREELPDTMAAIRLSGMEISDLTMELSDVGQDITKGVKSSTRAVRLAEERLRHFTNMAPSASLQAVTRRKAETIEPVVARSARGMREGIVKGRTILQMFFTLTRFSRFALNYITRGRKS